MLIQYLLMSLLIGIIPCIIIVVICVAIAKSGNKFRDSSRQISIGMTEIQVRNIMGSDPSFTKQHQDGSYEWIYEKSEWKGWLRGGTMTRRMEIVFSSENEVISVGRNGNCDRTGW